MHGKNREQMQIPEANKADVSTRTTDLPLSRSERGASRFGIQGDRR